MVFGWFDAREAEEFGLILAEKFAQQFPPIKLGKEKDSERKRAEFVQHLFLQVRHFKQSHKLNLFKKAKLGNTFKWRLLDLGYDPTFVDQLTKELLVEV